MLLGFRTFFIVLANLDTLIDVLLLESTSDDNEVFLLQLAQSPEVFTNHLPLPQKGSQVQ